MFLSSTLSVKHYIRSHSWLTWLTFYYMTYGYAVYAPVYAQAIKQNLK